MEEEQRLRTEAEQSLAAATETSKAQIERLRIARDNAVQARVRSDNLAAEEAKARQQAEQEARRVKEQLKSGNLSSQDRMPEDVEDLEALQNTLNKAMEEAKEKEATARARAKTTKKRKLSKRNTSAAPADREHALPPTPAPDDEFGT